MDFDIFGLSPDIVNIQFGINDCNIWETDFGHPRVSKQSYIENIKEMIDRCLYKKVKYIIINSNHPLNRHKNLPNSRLSYEQMNTQYSSELTKVFKNYSKQVLFFDIRKEIIKSYHLSQKKYEYLIDDGVHLSQKGHDFYFEKFNKFLLNKLNFKIKMKINKQLINRNKNSNALITVDADWAPDFMIEKISNVFLNNNVSATFFVTHKSDYLKDLIKDKNFEIGIHFYKFAYKDEKVSKKT